MGRLCVRQVVCNLLHSVGCVFNCCIYGLGGNVQAADPALATCSTLTTTASHLDVPVLLIFEGFGRLCWEREVGMEGQFAQILVCSRAQPRGRSRTRAQSQQNKTDPGSGRTARLTEWSGNCARREPLPWAHAGAASPAKRTLLSRQALAPRGSRARNSRPRDSALGLREEAALRRLQGPLVAVFAS